MLSYLLLKTFSRIFYFTKYDAKVKIEHPVYSTQDADHTYQPMLKNTNHKELIARARRAVINRKWASYVRLSPTFF